MGIHFPPRPLGWAGRLVKFFRRTIGLDVLAIDLLGPPFVVANAKFVADDHHARIIVTTTAAGSQSIPSAETQGIRHGDQSEPQIPSNV
ncbi:MAG: hypothetical protein WCS42_03295 [Verrucomicrobiota bacterium]